MKRPANLIAAMMRDGAGRAVSKVRLSITPECNLHCRYCRPVDAVSPHGGSSLSTGEIIDICEVLYRCGIRRFRITGGEPTLRTDLPEIVRGLDRLPGATLGLTTNGILLARHLPQLADTGLRSLNVSLDSLDADRFEQITGLKGLLSILNALGMAKRFGFVLKLNMVVMAGVNDDELAGFLDFGTSIGAEVRFLEVMPTLGGANAPPTADLLVSHDRILEIISRKHHITQLDAPVDSTARRYLTETGIAFGIIASETKPFCGGCSRLRIDHQGMLYACLASQHGVSLRNRSDADIEEIIADILHSRKGMRDGIPMPLHRIGG